MSSAVSCEIQTPGPPSLFTIRTCRMASVAAKRRLPAEAVRSSAETDTAGPSTLSVVGPRSGSLAMRAANCFRIWSSGK